MSTSDGSIIGTTKVVDHGPNAQRFDIVILGDGYQASELNQYHTDVQNFVNTIQTTPPFDELWCAINVYRVDVTSTDSGADDPASCADGSAGSGAAPKTYFDSTFCGSSGVRRALTCNSATAQSVAAAQVTSVDMVMVIVNSSQYGGTGGNVATFSTNPSSVQIGIHEMGHTAFAFADEYEYLAGCASGETTQNNFPGTALKPNISTDTNRATIKWSGLLSSATDALPTTANADCTKCDTQSNPKTANYVGAYEGASTYHCGCYRPSFDCYMNHLGVPFCAVCEQVIRSAMATYMPAAVPLTWANPPAITYGTPLGAAQLNASAAVAGTFAYSPVAGTCLAPGNYTLNVTFTPNDFATYCFAKKSVPLTVNKATPVLNWANPANIVYGTPLDGTQLNANATWVECSGSPASVPGTYSYSPNYSTVLNAGVHTLSVTFTPYDTASYNPVSRSVSLTVLKATPTLNWANPPDIDHGTPLDDTQLNATASWVVGGTPVSVAGTFAYTPPKTTVLAIGPNQVLSVVFTPSDGANYNPANRTVHINVLTGYPIVMSVIFDPTTFPQEQRTQVTVVVKNDSIKPHATQGPNPGFEYSEGDTFETKGFPSIEGAYRIAVDLDNSPYKKAKLYRWGFGHTLAPGEVVSVNGFIRFHNSRENGQYYAAMVEEVNKFLIDHQGTTGITVLRP